MIMSQAFLLGEFRRRQGWSQAQLATHSGVSRTEISAIETGQLVPSVGVALRLSGTLNVSVEVLFGEGDTRLPVPWAWQPRIDTDARVWRATVGGRLLAYPVETTAAG
jgi:transcriptional regulator with XRE-family HTH domain